MDYFITRKLCLRRDVCHHASDCYNTDKSAGNSHRADGSGSLGLRSSSTPRNHREQSSPVLPLRLKQSERYVNIEMLFSSSLGLILERQVHISKCGGWWTILLQDSKVPPAKPMSSMPPQLHPAPLLRPGSGRPSLPKTDLSFSPWNTHLFLLKLTNRTVVLLQIWRIILLCAQSNSNGSLIPWTRMNWLASPVTFIT